MPRRTKSKSGRPAREVTDGTDILQERKIVGVEDMVLLQSLSNEAVLENLKSRHTADQIYTYIGQVLIVVNPYKWLPIYSESTIKQFERKARIDMPPHVFAVAEAAYRNMLNEEDNQCVIISGESGAGKTEASKQMQNYIASVSGGAGQNVERVKKVFLESNPLLESFGNAKTLRNNNSSRFGKYFELLFDHYGRPQGGKITNYLLEKSRVVKPGPGERNFHIFYQLLAGATQAVREAFSLSEPSSFSYLKVSDCFTVSGVDDNEDFNSTLRAMKSVGIKKKQIELVLQIVAAILHLGNVTFTHVEEGGVDTSQIRNKSALQTACSLLNISPEDLERALTYRQLHTMAPGGKIESYEVPQNAVQAAATRDGLSKSLYERVFDFLVGRINHSLDVSKSEVDEALDPASLYSIGILDIYGFEIFDQNGFEQFCINYVNEKLQQIFIELTLHAEQEEYEREGIAWSPIPFFNNKIVCEVIEGAQPPGIFRILDDTLRTAHSLEGERVDETFLDKVSGIHGRHPHFSKRGRTFEIKHYAGVVQYSVHGFSTATKDYIAKDTTLVIKTSTNKLIQYIYPEVIDLNDKKIPKTAGWRITSQCSSLVQKLSSCSPHYVRCIKSNEQKAPNKIDDKRVLHQIQYLGLLENIKVRRAGYAYRTDYGRFFDRFRLLAKETAKDWKYGDKRGAKAILRDVSAHLPALEKETQLGKTMIFIRTPETYFGLEKYREAVIGGFASKIQKAWRRYWSQRLFLTLQREMAKLYASSRKERRATSIYRPYQGTYLEDAEILSDIQEILEKDDEKISFLDEVERIACQSSSGEPSRLKRIFCLTNEAIYLLEVKKEGEMIPQSLMHNEQVTATEYPSVWLRRRLALSQLQGMHLSEVADNIVVIQVQPFTRVNEPIVSHWKDDKEVERCMKTNQRFNLFKRRHHCRVSGNIYIDKVCANLSVVPDLGFYTPVRVSDDVLGRFSSEAQEDLIICSEKKTEICAMIAQAVRNSVKGRVIPLMFGNSYACTSPGVPELSLNPQNVKFTSDKSLRTMDVKLSAADNVLLVTAPSGVPDSIILARKKRERKRRKYLEQKRLQDAELRAKRQATREAQREEQRRQRVADRKAKKAAEKEALRMTDTRGGKSTSLQNVRKFGEASASSTAPSQTSELAAALAKRRGMKA